MSLIGINVPIVGKENPRRAVVAFAVAALFSVLLVMLGASMAPDMTFEGYTWNVDSYSYVRALLYGPDVAFVPYKFRVLVPFMGSILYHVGVEPFESLLMVNMVAMYLFYIMVYACGYVLTKSYWTPMVGVVSIFLTYAHHHWYYRMPAMIDGSVALVIAVALYACLQRKFWLFLGAVIVGGLVHEYTLFLTPAWLFVEPGDKKKWISPMVAGLVVYISVRLTLDGGTYPGITAESGSKFGSQRLQNPGMWAREVLLLWGSVLVPVLISIGRSVKRSVLYGMLLCLFAGSMIASMMAQTLDRFLWWMAPIFAVGITLLVSRGPEGRAIGG